jgi:imidazole glycerol-phosphate synthase subunit HisF
MSQIKHRKTARLITRLEVKGNFVVKGIRMEGLRRVGTPAELTRKYFEAGIDEIIYNDIVASLYDRNHLTDLLSMAADQIFIPIVAGGGVRTLEGIRALLHSGADKISINSAAVRVPELITKASEIYGAQCIVVEIQAKKRGPSLWEPYIENGRERTEKDLVVWAKEAEDRGAGEILLTSVDLDGTTYGLDIEMIAAVTDAVKIPVIAAGGTRDADDIAAAVMQGGANAVSVSHILHFDKQSISNLKAKLRNLGVDTRHTDCAENAKQLDAVHTC